MRILEITGVVSIVDSNIEVLKRIGIRGRANRKCHNQESNNVCKSVKCHLLHLIQLILFE